jgi:hypothetical protein
MRYNPFQRREIIDKGRLPRGSRGYDAPTTLNPVPTSPATDMALSSVPRDTSQGSAPSPVRHPVPEDTALDGPTAADLATRALPKRYMNCGPNDPMVMSKGKPSTPNSFDPFRKRIEGQTEDKQSSSPYGAGLTDPR